MKKKRSPGDRFGKWTTMFRIDDSYWMCKCDCGTEKPVHISHLSSGKSKSCGCHCKRMSAGERYGKWTAIRKFDTAGRWVCRCECGNEKVVFAGTVTSGRSLGCRECDGPRRRSYTPTHAIWRSMNRRCFSVNNPAYPAYGGSGITVCERWMKFSNFIEDMGERPSPEHSIDRWPNMSGNYEPGNCRWATAKDQARNRRVCKFITRNGETKNLSEWCEIAGLPYHSVVWRIKKGWGVEKSLTTPIRKMKRKSIHSQVA